jgi:hypothetical protein
MIELQKKRNNKFKTQRENKQTLLTLDLNGVIQKKWIVGYLRTKIPLSTCNM